MTTILTTERWTFAGTDLNSYATLVQRVEAGDTLPGLRGDDVVIPSRTGRFQAGKRFDHRRIALAMWVSHLTAAGAEGVTGPRQSRENLDSLLTVLARRTTGALVRVMPDGTTRTATAECVAVDVPEYPVHRDAFPVVADFQLADPWFYGTDLVANVTVAASPTDLVITNSGSIAGERIVFDFLGPLSNPRVTNQANGWYVEALVTVAAAQHLILDAWAATALNNGLNAIGSVRHSGGMALLQVEPGANTLRITTGTTGGQVTATLKPPYA